MQDSVGEGAYVLGYTVYDRDGNYVATAFTWLTEAELQPTDDDLGTLSVSEETRRMLEGDFFMAQRSPSARG